MGSDRDASQRKYRLQSTAQRKPVPGATELRRSGRFDVTKDTEHSPALQVDLGTSLSGHVLENNHNNHTKGTSI